MHTVTIKTHRRSELIDVTGQIQDIVRSEGLSDGLVLAYVPHTTAGLTINENADPDVSHDLLARLEQLAPRDLSEYRHMEGNSDAHIKASLVGSSVTIMVEQSKLCLGRWQGIYFCEFDGPRTRQMIVKTNR